MAPPTTVSGILIYNYVSSFSATGAETAVNGEYSFLDETPVLRNPMCNGSEYQLSECKGYALNNVDGDYCLIGSHQVGVVCVEGNTCTRIKCYAIINLLHSTNPNNTLQ